MARKKRRGKGRSRLTTYDYTAVNFRVRYLCELLFGGNVADMAHALGFKNRVARRILSGEHHVTVRMLAHIAVKLKIRAAWLACGTGPVFVAAPESPILPAQRSNYFEPFDTAESSANRIFLFPPPGVNSSALVSVTHGHDQAGVAVYRARANNKLVGFFLGSTLFADFAAHSVLPFYQAGFANCLVMTLSAACYDLTQACENTHIDVNAVASEAMRRGFGYGETLGLIGLPPSCDRARSILASMYDMELPALVAMEMGEIAAHTAAATTQQEIGLAFGAAGYTDLLILTECLKTFFAAPGGVFIFAGEHVRGLRLILQRMESLQAVVAEQAGFTFVVFAAYDEEIERTVHHFGGSVIFLGYPTAAALTQLLQTCHDAYAGKISHEHKQ